MSRRENLRGSVSGPAGSRNAHRYFLDNGDSYQPEPDLIFNLGSALDEYSFSHWIMRRAEYSDNPSDSSMQFVSESEHRDHVFPIRENGYSYQFIAYLSAKGKSPFAGTPAITVIPEDADGNFIRAGIITSVEMTNGRSVDSTAWKPAQSTVVSSNIEDSFIIHIASSFTTGGSTYSIDEDDAIEDLVHPYDRSDIRPEWVDSPDNDFRRQVWHEWDAFFRRFEPTMEQYPFLPERYLTLKCTKGAAWSGMRIRYRGRTPANASSINITDTRLPKGPHSFPLLPLFSARPGLKIFLNATRQTERHREIVMNKYELLMTSYLDYLKALLK